MTVVSLRHDPVQRILESISDLSGEEDVGSVEVRRVAELVLLAARQGCIDLASLPFVVLGGLDGADLSKALSAAWRRWSAVGHPPAYAVAADYARQLGLRDSDPLFRAAVGLALDAPDGPRAVEEASVAVMLASMLERHGDVELSDCDRATAIPASLAISGAAEPMAAALSASRWVLRSGGDEREATRLAAIVLGALAEDSDAVVELCRACEDGRSPDGDSVPDESWVAVLAADPAAALIAGLVRDGRLVAERQRGEDACDIPTFASTAGALFGRLFAGDPEPATATPYI